MAEEIEINDLRQLTQTVKEKYGYDFTNYAMSSLKRRIARIIEMERLENFSNLMMKLRKDPNYVHEFVTEVTVNVTEMFRDPSFWRVLRDKIIPNILLNHDKISIWHAGCSSGEEVYSMAILLKEMGILEKSRIVATDLDTKILEKAKAGIYNAKHMDLNGKNYIRFQGKSSLEDYYELGNGKAYMDASLVENVSYRELDLVRGKAFSRFDLILCRNVMIYFNQNLQNEVLKLLHDSLFKYSYLAIGSKESLIWCDISNKFIVANSDEKIYKKIKD